MDTIVTIVMISAAAPIIGSLIGVLKKPSEGFMFTMLSFAAGVMMAISFLELIPESINYSSELISILGIISGSLVMYAVDRLIPHTHPEFCDHSQECSLKKTSIYLIFGIFLHNFPEGMAIAIGTVSQTKISLIIALAIAIHNIPEGICTSAPYYHCTGDRLKSFLVSSVTAVPILLGFIAAYYIFKNISMVLIGYLIAFTAGIMIFICVDELIPTSSRKVTNHGTIFPFIIGTLFVMLLEML
ncbi:MAG: ZIP family metal transporter [Bacillota bacterium]|nr:ZIP family metal transporter [Bacillota bacterium]